MKLLLPAASVVLICCSALAGPLRRSDVAAQPVWALHVDVDGLRSSKLGVFLMDELQKPEAQAKFAALQMMVNFDPRTQLHGATLYTTGNDSKDGVLIVYADFEPERLVTLARAAKEYQSAVHGNHAIHSWIDDKKADKPRVYAAIHRSRVLFGQRQTTVAAALDVLDGSANLQSSGLFPQLGTGSAFIQAASRKIDVAEGDPNAAVLKQSKGVRLEIGETAEKVFGNLTLQTDNGEVAGHIHSIANGLLSLVKLQARNPAAAKLAENAVLSVSGANVVCSWGFPAEEVVTFLKQEAARKAAERASN